MKAFITPSYTFTPGASGGGTIDLSSITGFDIKRLIAIINQTRGELIYSTGSSTLKYTSVVGGVVTLFADTSTQSSTDTLQIIYEGIGQKASASSHAMVLSTEQEAILNTLSTSAKQDLAKAVLDSIKANSDTLNGKDFSSSAKQDLAKAVLDLIQTNTSNTSSKLPATLGQKTKANSLGITIASDQDTLNTQGATLDLATVAGTALNADVIPSVDVSKYKVLYIHNLNSFVGTITFQGSMDNTNWVAIQASPQTSPSTVANTNFSGSNGATLSIFTVPVVSKYFRLRLTAYTSGICNVVGMASTSQSFDYATKYFAANAPILTTSTNSTVTGTVTSAQVTVGTTAVRATVAGTAPNAARKLLLVKPSAANTGKIFIGPSTVTTSNALEIIGPDRVEFDFDAGDYYLISDTAGQTVELIEKV